jgi:hypothetical protein
MGCGVDVWLYISLSVCSFCNVFMSHEASNDRWTLKEIYQLRQARAACCAFDLEKYSVLMTQELQDKLERLGDPLIEAPCVLEPLEPPVDKAVSGKTGERKKVQGFHPKWR